MKITSDPSHDMAQPSEWICRWSPLIEPGGSVLDVACGFGRHVRWFHSRHHAVVGIDRSTEALRASSGLGDMIAADLESEPWPLLRQTNNGTALQQFDAVVVCNYLWRPLLPTLLASVKAGGVFLYETFAVGNEKVGKPSRPDFLLKPGELLDTFKGWRIIAYEDVFLDNPARYVQRIAAIADIDSNVIQSPRFGP